MFYTHVVGTQYTAHNIVQLKYTGRQTDARAHTDAAYVYMTMHASVRACVGNCARMHYEDEVNHSFFFNLVIIVTVVCPYRPDTFRTNSKRLIYHL